MEQVKERVVLLLLGTNGTQGAAMQRLLESCEVPRFIVHRMDLAEARVFIAQRQPDVVILHLHQSACLSELSTLRRNLPNALVVVLTAPGEEDLGVSALRCGANEHVPIIEATGQIFGRLIWYSFERLRQRRSRSSSVLLTNPEAQLGKELGGFDWLEPTRDPLDDPHGLFLDIVRAYKSELEWVVQAPHLPQPRSSCIPQVAKSCCRLNLSAKDIVSMHSDVLRSAIEKCTSHAECQAYVIGGRTLALQVLGNMADQYRKSADQIRRGRDVSNLTTAVHKQQRQVF